MKLSIFLALAAMSCATLSSDEVVWSGKVKSDGTPSEPIRLTLHESYEIKIKGYVNLGKWVQAGEKLATDACYEFSKESQLDKIESVKNSQNISVCDGSYHADHIYTSQPFEAKQNIIHFWVYDTDYDDNSGAFDVEVIQKD